MVCVCDMDELRVFIVRSMGLCGFQDFLTRDTIVLRGDQTLFMDAFVDV